MGHANTVHIRTVNTHVRTRAHAGTRNQRRAELARNSRIAKPITKVTYMALNVFVGCSSALDVGSVRPQQPWRHSFVDTALVRTSASVNFHLLSKFRLGLFTLLAPRAGLLGPENAGGPRLPDTIWLSKKILSTFFLAQTLRLRDACTSSHTSSHNLRGTPMDPHASRGRADGQSGPSQSPLPDAAAAAGSGKAAKTKGGNTTKKGGGKSDGGEPCSNCGTLGATSRCSQCRQNYYCGKACFKVRGCASVGG